MANTLQVRQQLQRGAWEGNSSFLLLSWIIHLSGLTTRQLQQLTCSPRKPAATPQNPLVTRKIIWLEMFRAALWRAKILPGVFIAAFF